MRPQAMIEQTLNLVTTKDHQQVAVWRIIDDEVFDKNLGWSLQVLTSAPIIDRISMVSTS